ncbi:hypothetical protein CERZMDRAFT_86021 [Cercospora zeae-maydis SCOH1-5]|uniref:Hypervirulence associated protein TUDOR domain-containing protein n=1 Tax=Cercospora zeae-maydis SCOH1-5 TaxID=717836 RepID=A0A6A6FBD9_9PEZI|nr:hypothetical protein CERZMDRAFT_86021 [Cercospora zeae-maydis SCOH1-5]
MADNEIKEGDSVSWQWSGSRPGGTVAEVKEQGKAEITTKNDNVVSKNAEPDNPAIVIERSGNNVVKKASEVDVEKPGDKHKEDQGEEKTVTANDTNDTEKKENGDKQTGDKQNGDKQNGDKQNGEKEEKKEDGDAETGDKRKAEESAEDKKDEESADAKKQKTNDDKKENGEPAPKKKGRPAKNGNSAPKKDPKPKKRAATESGEPRRSGRNASK